MRWFYLFAAILVAAMTAFHVTRGAGDVLVPALSLKAAAPAALSVLQVIWHFITAFLALSALALLWAIWAVPEWSRPLGIFLAVVFLSAGGLFGWFAFDASGDPLHMPQWLALVPAGLFSLLGGSFRANEAHMFR